MAGKTYGQFCGLARAIELVGERWAPLILRDLLVGPRRFTDLRKGLPKIPTNILAARLRELEQTGVVRRRVLPRPAAAVVYELTEYGQDLREVFLQLGAWGARSLGHPRADDIVTAGSLVLALQATFRADRAAGFSARYQIEVGEVVLHARVDDGRLEAGEGPIADAGLTIEAGPMLKALMAGELAPREAIETGRVRVRGDAALLDRFVEIFHVGPKPGV
jgi:DNA-binding HxlR family transcriptional regulator/putative sterol carrier protein